MRVTNRMIADSALRNISGNLEGLSKVQDQISSGKQILRPSDDPVQTLTAIKARESLAEIKQYLRNIDGATAQTAAADSALNDAGQMLQRARELAVQGANATLSASDRQAMAAEVEQLSAQVVSDSATRLDGGYIFSGFKTDTAPFTVTGPGAASAYAGDQKGVLARIGPGETVQVNVPGDTAFGAGLQALQQLHDELMAGTPVSSATLAALDAGVNATVDARAVVGARQNRLEQTQTTLQDQQVSVSKLLSDTEDVDMAAAISEMSRRQLTYDAALKISGQILQRSLLDELK